MVRIILRPALIPKLRVCRYRVVRIQEDLLYNTLSATVYGIDSNIIEVEVDVAAGKPLERSFPHGGTAGRRGPRAPRPGPGRHQELRLRDSPHPDHINLVPADIRKQAQALTCPIALGIRGAWGIEGGS